MVRLLTYNSREASREAKSIHQWCPELEPRPGLDWDTNPHRGLETGRTSQLMVKQLTVGYAHETWLPAADQCRHKYVFRFVTFSLLRVVDGICARVGLILYRSSLHLAVPFFSTFDFQGNVFVSCSFVVILRYSTVWATKAETALVNVWLHNYCMSEHQANFQIHAIAVRCMTNVSVLFITPATH